MMGLLLQLGKKAGDTRFYTDKGHRDYFTIVDPMVVYHCTRSALLEAMRNGASAMAFPAFGAGTGMVPFETVARLMGEAYDQVASPPEALDWRNAHSRSLPDTVR